MISERGHEYDDLAAVNYHLLPEAFGCKGWIVAKVSTNAELEAAFAKVAAEDSAAYLEVMIPNEESQPTSSTVATSYGRLRWGEGPSFSPHPTFHIPLYGVAF